MLPLFVLAHFAHHLLSALPTPLLPMIRSEFGLDYTRSGLIISAFSLSYGIGQLPAGWLADRVGLRVLITSGICGVALAGLLVGLSQNYVMLVISFVLMGLLGGGYHPGSPPLITASVEPRHQGRALGLHLMGSSASFFLAPLVAAAIAVAWGWRGPFITLAIPTMVFGVIFYRRLGRLEGTIKKNEPAVISGGDRDTAVAGLSRRLAAVIILSAFTHATILSVMSFIPLYLVDHFGVAQETAAAFIAIFYSTGLWANFLGGYLADRLGKLRVIMAVCFGAALVIYLFTLSPSVWSTGVLLIALGTISYIRMPVAEAYLVNKAPLRHRSAILGVYYFSGMEGAGVLTPLVGYLVDHLGFYNSFTIAGAAVFAVALAGSLWLGGSRD